MHFINLDALGGPSAHIFYLVKGHSILFSPNVCLFWEIFLPFMHTLEAHLQGTFISKQYPHAGALQMDHSILPTKKTNCHWKADFPRLGCGVDAWGRRVGFFWDSDGSFGSLLALWLMKTLIWNNSPLTKCVHWILRLYNVNANESQVKESSHRGTREERGYFQMRFEMRSWVDEVKTCRMAIPDGRNCRRCHWVFVFREREKHKGKEKPNSKSTTYSTEHCFKIRKC